MTLDRLILDDFLTYDHLDYVFEKRPLLVQGLNLTDDRQKSNGSGKSGIPTGIEFCITASNSRDVRDNELVTFGKEHARAQLFASCDVRKERLHIDWTINVKGSNTLRLKTKKYDDDEWTPVKFSNVNDGKKFVLAWFAISKEDLFNYYIINQTRFKSFFKSSNKEKVDLINRFSDASIVDGIDKVDNTKLDSEFKAAEKNVNTTEGAIIQVEGQVQKELDRDFKEEMLEDKSDLEEEIISIELIIQNTKLSITKSGDKINLSKEDIAESKESIVTAASDKADIEKEISEIGISIESSKEELTAAELLVKAFKDTDWIEERSDYEGDLASDESTLNIEDTLKKKLNNQETDLLKFIQKINVNLEGSIQCPKCNHEFILDGDIDSLKNQKSQAEGIHKNIVKAQLKNINDIDSIKKSISTLGESLSKINKEEQKENAKKNTLNVATTEALAKLSRVEIKLKSLEQELKVCDADVDDYNSDIKNSEQEIKNIEASIDNYNKSIENNEAEIELYRGQITALKEDNSRDRIKELEKDLNALNKTLESNKKKLSIIGDKIYLRNQWANNFKQFRMFLANQSLEVMEYHNNRYLSDMGSDLRVKMEGFKILADGSQKEEITAKIIRNQERTFASFSGGEKGRLLFVSILANRYMINETHPYGGLDFLSIDEIFEGVDSIGLKYLIEPAKVLGIAVMIITHVTDEELDSDSILVIKENDISRIRERP